MGGQGKWEIEKRRVKMKNNFKISVQQWKLFYEEHLSFKKIMFLKITSLSRKPFYATYFQRLI